MIIEVFVSFIVGVLSACYSFYILFIALCIIGVMFVLIKKEIIDLEYHDVIFMIMVDPLIIITGCLVTIIVIKLTGTEIVNTQTKVYNIDHFYDDKFTVSSNDTLIKIPENEYWKFKASGNKTLEEITLSRRSYIKSLNTKSYYLPDKVIYREHRI